MTNPTIENLVQRITDLGPGDARLLIAIAGPPASGKSTFAEELATRLGTTTKVMPMDGFHMDNEELSGLGLLHRKGAPETFDAKGFVQVVRQMRTKQSIFFPTFDRVADKTVPDGGKIGPDTRIVLIEGNYLLLETAPWDQLRGTFDLTIGLSVDQLELERRLIARWLKHGLSPDQASTRARENDLRNARFVCEHSFRPDMTMTS